MDRLASPDGNAGAGRSPGEPGAERGNGPERRYEPEPSRGPERRHEPEQSREPERRLEPGPNSGGARPGRAERLHAAGMAAALALCVVGQLVWLPDPLPLPGGMRWIEALDALVYLLALPPALWTAAAAFRLAEGLANGGRRRALIPPAASAVLGAAACAAVLAISLEPARMFTALGALGAAWIAAFADLACAERRRRGRRVPARTLRAFAAMLALLAVLFWPTGEIVTTPGLTFDVSRYARAADGEPKGRIDGVLVIGRPAFLADRLYAKLFPHYEFEPIEDLGMPLAEYDELVRGLKLDAEAAAAAIAGERTGRGEGIRMRGARVTAVLKDSPVSGALHAGDIITAVNGTAVRSIAELTGAMRRVAPGDAVELAVRRGGSEALVRAPTRPAEDDPERAVFGIIVENALDPDVPDGIRYRRYFMHEGGPSHGAMLALALLDQWTPGGVTGGLHVAGTGTIGPGGVIGQVGGVRQKAYAVSRTGADVFFVPAGQEDEARLGAPDLTIVPAATLDDVLNWLKSGG